MKVTNINNLSEVITTIESCLNDGYKVKLSIVGNSMYPYLKNKEHSVYLIKAENVKKNDIVLFKNNAGEIVLHRIIHINNRGFVAMGDGNLHKDERLPMCKIIAKVFAKEKKEKMQEVKGIKNALYILAWVKMRFMRPIILKIIQLFVKKEKKK